MIPRWHHHSKRKHSEGGWHLEWRLCRMQIGGKGKTHPVVLMAGKYLDAYIFLELRDMYEKHKQD